MVLIGGSRTCLKGLDELIYEALEGVLGIVL